MLDVTKGKMILENVCYESRNVISKTINFRIYKGIIFPVVLCG
jgi:hypothetical protein